MPYQQTWNSPFLQMPQFIPPITQIAQQPTNGITMVNGPDSALQHQLPPNSTSEPMFDMNRQMFYVVSTDGAGGKTIESFDWSEHVEPEPLRVNGVDFVSKAEFDEFAAKVNAVIGVNDDGTDESVQAEADA